jgi:hypothetical protein
MSTLFRAIQAVLVSIALTTLSAAQAFGQAKLDTVLVTGRGATLWEARQDAVRQALQQTRKQLVIADRAVSGDSLVRDEVLSTLNGFIEGFDVVSQTTTKSGSDWTMQARVVVSPSAMTQYIAPKNGGESSANVKGDVIFADIAAVRARREVNTKLYERLMDGFPWQAYDLSIEKVTLDAESERVKVSVAAELNGAFREQLKSSLIALVDAGSAERAFWSGPFDGKQLFVTLDGERPKGWPHPTYSRFWGIRLSPVTAPTGLTYNMVDAVIPPSLPVFTQTPIKAVSFKAIDLAPSYPRAEIRRFYLGGQAEAIIKAIDQGQRIWASTFVELPDGSHGLPVMIETRSHMIFTLFRAGFFPAGTNLTTNKLRVEYTLPAEVFEGTNQISIRPTDFFESLISKRTVVAPDCTKWSKKPLGSWPTVPLPSCISEITTPSGTWVFDSKLMSATSLSINELERLCRSAYFLGECDGIPVLGIRQDLGHRSFFYFKRKTAEQREQ